MNQLVAYFQKLKLLKFLECTKPTKISPTRGLGWKMPPPLEAKCILSWGVSWRWEINKFSNLISKLKSLGWNPSRNVYDSVIEYKEWLDQADRIDDIVEYCNEKMKKLNVVRDVS